MIRLLDDAEAKNPDDDRVWLGRAYLETRRGRFDEADSLLVSCEPRGPMTWPSGRRGFEWAQARGAAR